MCPVLPKDSDGLSGEGVEAGADDEASAVGTLKGVIGPPSPKVGADGREMPFVRLKRTTI